MQHDTVNNSITNFQDVFKSKPMKNRNNYRKIQKILKNGQIILDLSDLSAMQNASDNNIINYVINVFKSIIYKFG